MMMIMSGLSPLYILNIRETKNTLCEPMPFQATYKETFKLHKEHYTLSVHTSSPNMMSTTSKALNARTIHEICPTTTSVQ